MKLLYVVLWGLVSVLSVVATPERDEGADPVTVRIVPTSCGDDARRSLRTEHFFVVVSNTSEKPVRLWKEFCSWGYTTLSFQVEGQSGKRSVVVKTRRPVWRKNTPDWMTITPGDHMVFNVAFGSQSWQTEPLTGEIKLKAVFEISKDKQTDEHKVWTGRIESPQHTYTIHR
jgi:hypothetical protein